MLIVHRSMLKLFQMILKDISSLLTYCDGFFVRVGPFLNKGWLHLTPILSPFSIAIFFTFLFALSHFLYSLVHFQYIFDVIMVLNCASINSSFFLHVLFCKYLKFRQVDYKHVN